MQLYLDLLKHVLDHGEERKDRTGVGTVSIFGAQMHIDISKSFPLLTTKKVHFKSIAYELLWFLKGETNIRFLQENNVRIWNEWADADGNLGPVYGAQWRHWKGSDGQTTDQIKTLIEGIKKEPFGRRHIVSAWNVGELNQMALPPCHAFFQFYVHTDGRLDCQLYQRSGDLFLGVPFNIASYSLLTYMVAQVCGLKPGTFVHTLGDAHIYKNHFEAVQTQLSRTPKELPTLTLDPEVTDIDNFTYESFHLENYDPYPTIKAIAAMASNRVIGRNNRLPWHLPEELQHFRQTTLQQTLLMGRKTFESMGSRPLPQRTTYVLTHHAFSAEGVHVITDISQIPATVETVWVCGGASIYAQLLPICDELLLSVIRQTCDGDAFFPPFEHLFKKVDVVKKTDTFEIQRWVSIQKNGH